MGSIAYTKFPNLHATVAPSAETVAAISDDFPISSSSEEIIYRAWARLLKAYTGDKVITFMSDEKLVTVDYEASTPPSVTQRRLSDSPVACPDTATGVFFNEEPTPSIALQLTVSSKTSLGRLRAAECIPNLHLPAIVAQFREILSLECPEQHHAINEEESPNLSQLNHPPHSMSGANLLHTLVYQSQDDTALAIDHLAADGERWYVSYSMLHWKAQAVAAKITDVLDQHQSSSRIIPVLLPQSPALYWTLLGILMAGYAFCPLNLDAPEKRIRFVVGDVSAPLLVTDTSFSESLSYLEGVQIITADSIENRINSTTTSMRASCASDPAYIMYTSGSTGTPKGVELSHMAVTQSLLAHDAHIPKFSRFLQFAAPTFDVSMFEIFFTFFRGATLVSCERQHLLNHLSDTINEMQVDAAELTPTVASGLLHGRESVPGLKALLTIGEMLTLKVVKEYGGSTERTGILHGMYGPTEAAIHCTLEHDFLADLKPTIIGRPLRTVSAFIIKPLDDHAQNETSASVLPVGHIGELAVGGSQLATGYLNRPEQNKKSYIDDDVYGRLYRTGDKARILPDGRIECLGRIEDGQVKLRGQRIELGEIEQTSLQVPACKISVASIIDGSLVLFCSGDITALTSKAIWDRCREVLPKSMVPNDVRLVETIPRLPSGKIDKQKLKQDYSSSIWNEHQEEEQAGDSPESQLCRAISAQIGRRIGPLTELKTLGIDSLRSIQMAAQLREADWNIGAIDLLKSRNVAQICFAIRERTQRQNDSSVQAPTQQATASKFEEEVLEHFATVGRASNVDRVLPCTPVQLSMLAETAVRDTAYFNSFTLSFPDTSVEDVERCVHALVTANEILRSGFCEVKNASHPYALIVWKALEPWQIRKANTAEEIEKHRHSLIRPLQIRLHEHAGRVQAVFDLHHALYDGWSVDLMVEELSRLLRDEEYSTRPQYSSVCNYWTNQTDSSAVEASKTFWKRQMQDFTMNQLPNLHGHIIESEELLDCTGNMSTPWNKVEAHASQLGISNQVFYQLALAYLLAGFCGNDDVTFANVSSGRTLPVHGIESIIGPCLATLPLRIAVSTELQVKELMRQIHQQNRDVMEHDSLTLGSIKRICGIDAGSSLCDVLFIWQETLLTRHGTLDNVMVVDSRDQLEYRLVVEVEPHGDTIRVKLRYRESLLPQEHAQLFLHQLDQAVEALLLHPEATVLSLCRFLPTDLVSAHNIKPTHHHFIEGLAYAVESHARQRPSEAAIIFYSSLDPRNETAEEITYAELNGRANALARQLQKHGVQPDDLVGICLEKAPVFYVSVLAVLKAGAGYLPITPETPSERVSAILMDAKPRICLASKSSSKHIRESGCQLLDPNSIDPEISHDNLKMPYVGTHVAYAVYTSGSTGTPKGLLVTQDNLQSNLKELASLYPNQPGNRLLQSCSQAFDVSVFEIFFTWQQGMCLCSASNDDLFRSLEHAIRVMRITHLSLTPTVAALIDPEQVPQVQFLVTAGEGVTEQVFRKWAGRDLLYQGYGPAETVNICTVKPRVTGNDTINNIGRTFSNTSAFVLHPQSDDPVPRGSVGELCFGGDQVCRGYLNRDSLTREKFIQHAHYGRLYRSGDLGRLLQDGSILFAGRADDQVKIRGQRIELGEINRVLMYHDFVSNCVSLVTSSPQNPTSRLITFWVPANMATEEFGTVLHTDSGQDHRYVLFESMAAQLPTYMIPSHLIAVTLLPQTTQGKLDRRRLQTCFESLSANELEQTFHSGYGNDDSSKMSGLEIEIAQSVAEVLQISQGDIHKNSSFFGLGLDSISAIRLSKAVQDRTDRSVLVSQILKHPSVSRLSDELLSNQNTGSIGDGQCPLLGADIVAEASKHLKAEGLGWESLLPCTPLQISMLSASFSASSLAYCNRTTLKMLHDTKSLKAAILRVLQRHAIFRTVFVPTSDLQIPFVQVVLKHHELSWQEDRANNTQARNELLEQLDTKVMGRLRGLQSPYVISFTSVASSEYVHLAMHHSLYDGVAMDLLFAEIQASCNGGNLPLPLSSQDFLFEVAKQQSDAALRFWEERLHDYLPVGFPQSEELKDCTSSEGQQAVISRTLPLRLSQLEDSCREFNVTLLAVLQSAWAKTLAGYTGCLDVCFGNVVSGRHLPIESIERLVAPCFNTIPTRVDLVGMSNQELLESLQQQYADTLAFSLTSLRKIQNMLELGGHPLFDSLVLLQPGAFALDSSLWEFVEESGNMHFPLILEFTPHEKDDQIQLSLHFAEKLITDEDAQALASMFCNALKQCLNLPSADANSIGDLGDSPSTSRDLPPSLFPLRNLKHIPSTNNAKDFGDVLGWFNNAVSRPKATLSEADQYELSIAVIDHNGTLLPVGLVGELVILRQSPTSQSGESEGCDPIHSGILARFTRRPSIQAVAIMDSTAESIASKVRTFEHIVDAAICDYGYESDTTCIFVVSDHGHDSDKHKARIEEQIVDTVKQMLPVFMMPDKVNFVKTIPYTRAGYINKKRLFGSAPTSKEHTHIAGSHGWTEAALAVRSAYHEVSKVKIDIIGDDTTIFKLGIDSIGAVQVASQLRRSYPHINANDVLEHPSCSDLAALLDGKQMRAVNRPDQTLLNTFDTEQAHDILRTHDIQSDQVDTILPCTHMQNGLLASSIHGAGALYLNHIRLVLSRKLRLAQIRKAWFTAVRTHQSLRMGFSHTKSVRFPFAMISYSQSFPTDAHYSQGDGSPTEWRRASVKEILDCLHEPPWRVFVQSTSSQFELNLLIHHALYDAHSLQQMTTTFWKTLNGAAISDEAPLMPALAAILEAADQQTTERSDFWRKQCQNMRPTKFPDMTPLREHTSTWNSHEAKLSISASDIEAACARTGISLQAAAQVAWGRLLSAYTGETSVTFGVVLSGRNTDDANASCFPHTVTVPFSCDVVGMNSAILRQAMKFGASIRRHMFTPLTVIQRIADQGEQALFDTVLAYQKPQSEVYSDTIPNMIDVCSPTEYPISLELETTDNDGLVLRITHDTVRLPPLQATLMLRQFDAIVRDVASNPHGAVEVYPLGDNDLISVQLPTESEIPSPVRLLHEWVGIQACKYPDRLALEFMTTLEAKPDEQQRYTYAELNECGDIVASNLRHRGIESRKNIAICFDKCAEASFAIVGVLKAGCAFVALDPTAPIDRIRFVLEDSKSDVVLSYGSLAQRLSASVSSTVLDLADASFWSSEKSMDRLAEIAPSDVCYCLYTSGTTGTPKGCEITHENVVQALQAFQRLFHGHWDTESRWLQFASFHFDVSVLEQFWSWSVGICVVSAPRDLILDDLASALSRLRISHVDLTPSLARLITPQDVPSLCKGVFITGGEKLQQEVLDAWGPECVIYNGYGPTEATIGVTMYPRVPRNGKPSNIGWQFDNVGTVVLAPGTDKPVLRGAVGELCVTGKLVGKGYLNRSDLTSERFPILEQYGGKAYRTGDLVRMLHDGAFDFLGRIDDQVKLRGQRLEIGEINHTIKAGVAAVQELVTLVIKHPSQQREQLVCFFTTSSSSIKSSELQLIHDQTDIQVADLVSEACRNKLPSYMIPSQFIPVNKIPLSVNNKADNNALKHFYSNIANDQLIDLSQKNSNAGTSLTSNETRVAEVIAMFLGNNVQTSIRASTTLYELGIDSINIFGLAQRFKKAGYKQATASLIARNSTVQRLTSALSTNQAVDRGRLIDIQAAKRQIHFASRRLLKSVCDSLKIQPQEVEDLAPCTPMQQGIISRSLERNGSQYYNAFYFELLPATCSKRLRQAWESVCTELTLLRTQFVPTSSGYVQVIRPATRLPWLERKSAQHVHHDSELQSARDDWLAKNSEFITRPFEIVIVDHGGSQIMVVHLFHALYDAISLDLLLTGVSAKYEGTAFDYGPSFLEVLPHGPLLKQSGAKDFWKESLRGAVSVKKSQQSPPKTSSVSSQTQLRVLKQLESRRRELGVTQQAILQACWMATLTAMQNGSTTTGLITSGRSIDFAGIDKVIGPLFNVLPFSLSVRSHDTWKSVILASHEFNTAVLPFQHTPLRDVRKFAQVPADYALFNSIFVFQKFNSSDIDSCPWKPIESPLNADYPIACEMEQITEDCLQITVVAQSSYLSHAEVCKVIKTLENCLTAIVADPNASLSRSIELPQYPQDGGLRQVDQHVSELQRSGYEAQDGDDPLIHLVRREIASLAGLDINSIQPDHSILELGLDSIDAVKLSSRLSKAQHRVPVSQVMKALTIRGISELLRSNTSTGDAERALHNLEEEESMLKDLLSDKNSRDKGNRRYLPTSPLQDAMVASMTASNVDTYFNHDVLRLSSDTDSDRLLHAIDTVIRHNAIWRTTFMPFNEPGYTHAYAQVVHPAGELLWNLGFSNKALDVAERISRSCDLVREHKPNTGLFYASVIEAPSERYLVLSIAHALYDGWSLALFHEDTRRAYYGRETQRPAYDSALAEVLSTATNEDAQAFWSAQLQDVSSAILSPNPDRHHNLNTVHRLERKSETSATTLKTFCKEHGITAQTLTMTCWAIVLAHRLRKLDVLSGVVLSGRDSSELNEIMFPTMNTVVLRAYIYGSVSELLVQTQEDLTAMREHQHYPLAKALRLANSEHRTLLNTLFIYQVRPPTDGSFEKPLYTSIEESSIVDVPVCVEAELDGAVLIWRTACTDEIFDREEVESLMDQLEQVLANFMFSSDKAVVEEVGGGFSLAGLPPVQLIEFEGDTSEPDESSMPDEAQAPWTKTERIVSKVVSSIAQVPSETISRQTTLYNAGLDSISAIKVSRSLRNQGLNIAVSELLRSGSIANISRRLDAGSDRSVKAGVDAMERTKSTFTEEQISALIDKSTHKREEVQTVQAATAGQVYMLASWINSRGNLFFPDFHYNVPRKLSLEQLEKAWLTLCNQTPILRTSFVATGDESLPFAVVTLKRSTTSLTKQSDPSQPQSQPFIALSVNSQGSEWLLKLKIHHALYDGVSLPLVIRRFEQLCSSVRADKQLEAIDLRALQTLGHQYKENQKFWTSYLQNTPYAKLNVPSRSQKRIELFDAQAVRDAESLRRRCNKHGISIHAAFLAAYAKVYVEKTGAHSAQQDVVLGVYLANRSHDIEDLAQAAVPTVNLLPIRVLCPREHDLIHLAHIIQQDLLQLSSLHNASVGLWQIQNWTGVQLDTFVNFLSLPSEANGDSDRMNGPSKQPTVRIQSLSDRQRESYSRSVQLGANDWAVPDELKGCPDNVLGAYKPSLDIEAAIVNGALTVGVFGQDDMVGGERGAADIVQSLRMTLEGMTVKDENYR